MVTQTRRLFFLLFKPFSSPREERLFYFLVSDQV